MGIRPCTGTLTTPTGTVIVTTFSPLTNVFTITITPSSDLFGFCISAPCVTSDFDLINCSGVNFDCGACSVVPLFSGFGGTIDPVQPAGTTQTYSITITSSLTFTAGTAAAEIQYDLTHEDVVLPCAPVCEM